MFVAALVGATFVVLVYGLARATLAPYSLAVWRMVPLTDASSHALFRRMVSLSVVAACRLFIESPAREHLDIPPELAVFYDFLADTVLALLMLSLLPKRLWRTIEDEAAGKRLRRSVAVQTLRFAVALTAITIPVTSLIGFRTFSKYLTNNLFLPGVVLGMVVVLHGVARDVITLVLEKGTAGKPSGAGALGAEDRGGQILQFWLVAAIDLGLLVAGVVLLLPVWGVDLSEVKEWMLQAVDGIRIGSFTLLITDLLIAIVVFVLVATRAFQRLLENRVFPQTRLDTGMRASLKTATGYTGLVIGGSMAVTILGLDLSSLAIIAGALSVGIGFGLQSIVNNFISGLILMFERPIKVGDWIVVGAHHGYVRQINVRATEIEKFDRSSVIVPNAELLSSALVNWTHKDTRARVEIPVGVAYGSDTNLVRDTLAECARKDPRILRWPEPSVLFMDFGDSSLDFELRFFIPMADEIFNVASDIRFAIDQAFRDAGIVIPFPQRDVHMQPADGSQESPSPPEELGEQKASDD